MMKLSIYRCTKCSKIRLVDRVGDEWICFACKQKVKKKPDENRETKEKKTQKKPKRKKK